MLNNLRFSAVALLAMVSLMSSGVMAEEKISPLTVKGAPTVDAAQAKALFDKGVVFVDVRSDKDWGAGRIPDAVHLELNKVFNEATLVQAISAKDKPVVMYCNGHSCMRSSEAAEKAVGWGFTKVYYFRDGYPAWKSAGYPVE